MCVGSLGKVYEVAPVFRAEEHDSSRHLNEYISITAPVVLVSEKKIDIDQNDLLPSYLASIWQPPKSC